MSCRSLVTVLATALVLAAWAPSVSATKAEGAARTERLPKRLEDVGVDERLGGSLPLDLGFTDSSGKPVMLREYFDGKHPVIVTLNYADCPMLCSMILNGLVEAMKQLDWTAGHEYRVVTVSLNPNEGPERARQSQTRYLSQYARTEDRGAWHFLTGSEQNVRVLASALGIRYGYNEKRAEYVHPSVISLASPHGKVARYLYGIEYHPKTLRLSLVEASEGKIGSSIDKLLLYCFHYDSSEGAYAPVAMNIMRLSGGLAVLLLGTFLAFLWRGELRRRKLAENHAA
jgi:protein SCO1/2